MGTSIQKEALFRQNDVFLLTFHNEKNVDYPREWKALNCFKNGRVVLDWSLGEGSRVKLVPIPWGC